MKGEILITYRGVEVPPDHGYFDHSDSFSDWAAGVDATFDAAKAFKNEKRTTLEDAAKEFGVDLEEKRKPRIFTPDQEPPNTVTVVRDAGDNSFLVRAQSALGQLEEYLGDDQ